MTLAEGAVAAYDEAVDAAETHEMDERTGVGLVASVRITSSANPVPEGPAADSPCRPQSRERSAAMRTRAVY